MRGLRDRRPDEALIVRNPSDAELYRWATHVIEAERPAVFACRVALGACPEDVDRSKVAEVACLARLDEGMLLSVLSAGAEQIALVRGDCAACSSGCAETITRVRESVVTLLSAWGAEPRLELFGEFPDWVRGERRIAQESEAVAGVSRRDFLLRLTKGAKSAAADVVLPASRPREEPSGRAKVSPEGVLPQETTRRSLRVLRSLERLGKPIAEHFDTRLWAELSIDAEKCSSCRMCATFCPTGSLTRFDDERGAIGVTHCSALCNQCGMCADICPKRAISLSPRVSIELLAAGDRIRHEMRPIEKQLNRPDSMYGSLYELLGGGQIYER